MNINPRWDEQDNLLRTTIETGDFVAAVALIGEIAALAEEKNHHPDLALHDYSKLTITLHTHEDNGLSSKDYELARDIDRLLEDDATDFLAI